MYEKSLNPSNLRAAFKKTAIYENNNADNNDTIEKRADESIFCIKRGGNVLKAVTAAKKPRRNISTVVGGKAITESDTFAKV